MKPLSIHQPEYKKSSKYYSISARITTRSSTIGWKLLKNRNLRSFFKEWLFYWVYSTWRKAQFFIWDFLRSIQEQNAQYLEILFLKYYVN